MNSVDVDIYLAQLMKFFKDNPTDLNAIIGDLDSEKFYEQVRIQALHNIEKGEDVQLSQIQIMNIVVRLTRQKKQSNTKKPFLYHHLNTICLN
jgi:hypothetical protein